MKYPLSLIPLTCWKQEIVLDDLSQDDLSFFVIRRLSVSIEELRTHQDWIISSTPDSLKLSIDCDIADLDDKRMPDMSMSIISEENGLNEASFSHAMLKEFDSEYWDGEKVNLKEFKNHLRGQNPGCFLGVSAQEIHNLEFNFEKKYPNESSFKLEKDKRKVDFILGQFEESFKKDSSYSMIGKLKLKHKPTPLNYWHITLEIYDPEPNIETRTDKGWRKNLGRLVRNLLIEKGK